MVRILASSPAQSSTSKLLKRVFVQMSDLSEQLCSNLVKCVLNYAIELLGEIVIVKEDTSNGEDAENNNETKSETNAECDAGESVQQQQPLEESSQESCVSNEQAHSQTQAATEIEIEDANEIDSIYDTNFMDENSVSNFGMASPSMCQASEDSKSLAELSQNPQGKHRLKYNFFVQIWPDMSTIKIL